MRKSRKLALLMMPILAAYVFQATQYARAPVRYNFYVVYAKNADIALKPGKDKGPNGDTLLQNSTLQAGLYNLTLGQWGPGYRVNYTDAFNVTNNEVFVIRMIAFNFSATSEGKGYLKIYALNDTDNDGFGETEVCVWNGTHTLLSASNYLYFKAAATYGQPGGTSRVKIMISIPETGVALQKYEGTVYLWFTSTE